MALKNGKGTVNGYEIGPQVGLQDANLRGAGLGGADLRGANLQDADLSGAYLREAQLQGANLVGADLRNADLSEANLFGADLVDARLSGACFYSAVLGEAQLWHTDLTGVDFSEAIVDEEHVTMLEDAHRQMIRSLRFLDVRDRSPIYDERTPNPRYSLPRVEFDPIAEERAKAEYFEGIESGRYPSPHDMLQKSVADGALRRPARPRSPSRKHRGR